MPHLAYVLGQYVVISKDKVIPLYKVNADGTVALYPKFRELWAAFIPTFAGQYNIKAYANTLPSTVSEQFHSISALDDGFIVFNRETFAPIQGPIINVEPNIVVLDTFNPHINYELELNITVPRNVTPGLLGVYTLSGIVADMSLLLTTNNELTLFPVQHKMKFTLWNVQTINEFAIHCPAVRNGVIINLKVTAKVPNKQNVATVNKNTAFGENYICFNHHNKNYKLLATATMPMTDDSGDRLTVPATDLGVLNYLMLETLSNTSRLPPLVPIIPLQNIVAPTQECITCPSVPMDKCFEEGDFVIEDRLISITFPGRDTLLWTSIMFSLTDPNNGCLNIDNTRVAAFLCESFSLVPYHAGAYWGEDNDFKVKIQFLPESNLHLKYTLTLRWDVSSGQHYIIRDRDRKQCKAVLDFTQGIPTVPEFIISPRQKNVHKVIVQLFAGGNVSADMNSTPKFMIQLCPM